MEPSESHASPEVHTPADAKCSPRSLTDLFVSFTLLALQGFGGVLAVVQRELVEKNAGSPARNLSKIGPLHKFCLARML